MKTHLVILVSIASLATAVPVSVIDSYKAPVKRGIFDFPFLSSAHGSSSSSSKDHEHDHEYDFHDFDHHSLDDYHSVSHATHHSHYPEYHPIKGHHHDFHHYIGHDDGGKFHKIKGHHHDVHHYIGHDDIGKFHKTKGHHYDFHHGDATSYQNQYFGHDDVATSYQNQYLYDNHISSHDHSHNDHINTFDSLLDHSHLDVPELKSAFHKDDYKNYGGDLGQYSQHAGLLDISEDHSIDHLLDPYLPSHSSYDSF